MQTKSLTHPAHLPGRHRPPEIRQVSPGRVFVWFREGWRLFVARPLEWILMAFVAFLLLAASSLFTLIPLIGPLLPVLMLTILLGGMFCVVHQQSANHVFSFALLFEGFRRHPGNLVLIGLFYALPLVLMHFLTMLAIGGQLLASFLGWWGGTTLHQLVSWTIEFLAGLGVLWILFLIAWGTLLLAMLFAPALAMLDNYSPFDAMQYSLKASLKSLGAMVLLAFCLYMLFLVAMIPFGLGIFVYIPLVICSLYSAYRDVLAALPQTDQTEGQGN